MIGSLINKEGVNFLRTLSESESVELFSQAIIKHIINFLWIHFRRYIFAYSLVPYISYMILFLLYATYFHKIKYDNNYDFMESFGVLNDITNIILLFYIIYFLYFEIRQILFHRLNYFSSVWNIFDLTSLLMNLAIQILDLANLSEEDLITITGIAVLLVWLKLFYFGRIFFSTASIIRIIIEITYDMKFFLGVLLLSIAAFGNCFYILQRNHVDNPTFAGNTWLKAFLYSYIQALGQFDTSIFTGTDKHLYFTIFFLNTIISMIVMLNMLVAIMGDTFDRVIETAESSMYRELASAMIENEMIVNRHRIFGDAKYIIIIQEERADELDIGWEGRINHIKNFIYRQSYAQSKILKEIEKDMLSQIKFKAEKRGKDLEISANRHFQSLFEKLSYLESILEN